MSDPNVWQSSSNWRSGPSNNTSARPAQAKRSSGSWRNDNSETKPVQRQPVTRWAERPRPQDINVHRPERQQDEPDAGKAISEGRRIYLGNLLYRAKPEDIEELLATNGLSPCEKIHISIDAFSGRNPGYCFIEFADRDAAATAMVTLDEKLLLGRPVKSRPCQPKGERRRGGREPDGSDDPGASRWGDWGSKRDADAQDAGIEATDAPQDRDRIAREGRQLYVGGLPRMLDQAMNNEEMRDIFKDFEV